MYFTLNQFLAFTLANNLIPDRNVAEEAALILFRGQSGSGGLIPSGISTDLNTYTVTLSPPPVIPLQNAQLIEVFFVQSNTVKNPTLNANGTGDKGIVKQGGQPLDIGDIQASYPYTLLFNQTSNKWVLLGRTITDIPFGTATGTDAYQVGVNNDVNSGNVGLVVNVTIPNTNTGASTLDVNTLGAKPILKQDSTALVAGDLIQNTVYQFFYDGTNWRVIGGITQKQISQVDTGAADAYDIAVPTGTVPTEGMIITVKFANANTGASTLALNGAGALPINKNGLNALAANDILSNQVYSLYFDGTANVWIIIGSI